MLRYVLQRLYQSIFVIVGVTLVVFLVLQLAGDPVLLFLPPGAPMEMAEEYREALGFNDPLYVQYFHFLAGAVNGDFGTSYYYKQPAMKMVLERLPATVELTLAGMIVAILWGVPAGIISAIKRNTRTDLIIRVIALLGQCIPVFWLGIMMIFLFAVELHWLPTSGRGTLAQLVMPAISLGLFTSATITRLLRSSMIEILNKEYILVARAKGLSKKLVVLKHALKNAVSSVLTILGLQVAALLGGAVITETVFAWPGIGRLAVQSIYNRDFSVVEAVVVLMAVSFVLVNLLVDICYAIIDPRIRYK